MDENALNIFTDGSSLPSPRSGGIGIRFVFPYNLKKDEIIKDFDLCGYKGATNNQMELSACLIALKEAQKLEEVRLIQRIVIHTDSQYVVENYKRAMFQWSVSKWLKSTGSPVMNADIWKDIVRELRKTGKRVDFEWVKGHSKNEHNKAVDKLAKNSAKKPLNSAISVVAVRRKLSQNKVSVGSIPMLGQKISIRIITREYLRVQKTTKFKVIS